MFPIKKKILAMILAVATMLGLFAVPASAAESGPRVRVNGYLVEFPDAQPYIDENSRTMIPVRFVTEAMEADVSWVQATQTAVIEKDGIKVEITIGKQDIKVTKNGKTETVTMDTVAVNRNSRTYVPIRYVAEALGAYVEYASLNRTVAIYIDGTLTTEEIVLLRCYPMGNPSEYTYDKVDDPWGLWGTAEDRAAISGNFTNAHEYEYYRREQKYDKYANAGAYYEGLVNMAIQKVNHASENVTVVFKADTSCIYQSECADGYTTVRGILEVTVKDPSGISHSGRDMTHLFYTLGLNGYGLTSVAGVYRFAYDVHMLGDNSAVGGDLLDYLK